MELERAERNVGKLFEIVEGLTLFTDDAYDAIWIGRWRAPSGADLRADGTRCG